MLTIVVYALTAKVEVLYIANRMRNATIRQKRPMASERAKPKMA